MILYAGEREWFPATQFEGPDNLVFCLDDSLPLGSAQHQKFVVIDDAHKLVLKDELLRGRANPQGVE